MALVDDLSSALEPIVPDVLGVYLFGSHASGEGTPRSDVDLCLVGGKGADPKALLARTYRLNLSRFGRVDLHIFESMPLFLKAAVLQDGIIVASRDEPALGEYLVVYRRMWADQARRQELSHAELVDLLEAGTHATSPP